MYLLRALKKIVPKKYFSLKIFQFSSSPWGQLKSFFTAACSVWYHFPFILHMLKKEKNNFSGVYCRRLRIAVNVAIVVATDAGNVCFIEELLWKEPSHPAGQVHLSVRFLSWNGTVIEAISRKP